MKLSRRALLRVLATAPVAAPLFPRLAAQTASYAGKLKITAIKAMAIKNIANNCLIKIETDQGVTGYGEAGSSGPMARARIQTMQGMLIGQDPLAIEKHFHFMSSLMHTYTAHIPTVSGIDMALWDLAGKVTGLPVCVLLGGPFRDAIAMYSHGNARDMMDKTKAMEWGARVKSQPEGFKTYKIGIDPILGVPAAKYAATLTSEQLRNVGRVYGYAREAVGDAIDIAVHCHNELDTPSAINVCKVVEPMNPLFVEDPLDVPFHEGWASLKRSTTLTILTGEKLEGVRGFKPFIDHQACDIIHPDLAFAGGFTGTKKIANYAYETRTPVALHNVGSIILTYASAHFGGAIQNFYRSESALGRPTRHVEQMVTSGAPEVTNGQLKIPTRPGLGLDLNQDYLKANLVDGEPWWG
jgi:L-alanine-DL-glutamate epimerase-like enolase superfamily enzyme